DVVGASAAAGEIKIYVLASVRDSKLQSALRRVDGLVGADTDREVHYTVRRDESIGGRNITNCTNVGTIGSSPWWMVCDELIAGQTWMNRNPGHNGVCTVGFLAGPPTVYAPYMYTAGHCNEGVGPTGYHWDGCRLMSGPSTTCGWMGSMESVY